MILSKIDLRYFLIYIDSNYRNYLSRDYSLKNLIIYIINNKNIDIIDTLLSKINNLINNLLN